MISHYNAAGEPTVPPVEETDRPRCALCGRLLEGDETLCANCSRADERSRIVLAMAGMTLEQLRVLREHCERIVPPPVEAPKQQRAGAVQIHINGAQVAGDPAALVGLVEKAFEHFADGHACPTERPT